MRTFLIVFAWEILTLTLTFSLTVETEKTRVRITAVDDTIVFRFLRPRLDARLEGFILGYGSSVFSKQLIHLPGDGQPFETEMDAEPRYMIALQSVASWEPKKKCTGKVNLKKPLNVVIGSVSDSSVLLSWGMLLQSPFVDSVLDDCFDDGQFTVRYREKEPRTTWSYQTCPTTSTVIDKLKPDAVYEFRVRADSAHTSGVWSPPVVYNTPEQATRENVTRPNPANPEKSALSPFLPPQPDSLPGQFSEVDKLEDAFQHCLALCVGAVNVTPAPGFPLPTQTFPSTLTSLTTNLHTTTSTAPTSLHPTTTQTPPTSTPRQIPPSSLMENPRTSREQVKLQRFRGRAIFRNSSSASRPLARNITQRLRTRIPPNPPTKAFRTPLLNRNSTLDRRRVPLGERRTGIWASKAPKDPKKNQAIIKLNQVSETKEKDGVIDLKQMSHEPVLKPLVPPSTMNLSRPSPTAPQTAFDGSRFNTGDNSSVFSPHPISEVDSMGKKRFTANHVIYKTDKRPEEPCSVTNSLSFFPDQEVGNLSVTSPPKTPPTNLTVVTVEGCPSFVILDWEESDNETTEYEVVSSTKGPHGEEVSILTTNQTHTAVENLKPESSYEFKVTPKNELGSGPASDPVNFSTESADPRVSETPTGKNAIWSSFPFKSDSYSECNGRQFVKRTWYRKFVGIQLCNSLRYKIYLSDSLKGKFYSIGDQTGYGEDHCQFVDSFLDGRTGGPVPPDQLPSTQGFFRAMRQEPVTFGEMGGSTRIHYVAWYECGIPIPGKW